MIDASVASAGVSPSVLLRCIEPTSGGSVDHRGQGAELLLSPGWCWLWLASEGSLLLDGEGTHDSSLPLPLPGPGVLHPGHVTSAWGVTIFIVYAMLSAVGGFEGVTDFPTKFSEKL